MKKFKKAIAFLLVVCMLVTGNMSLFANAAESDSTSEIGSDMFYRVFHVDAARKFFNVTEIISLIDIAVTGGYNQFELYLADNQGLRFALKDMTVTTEHGTYDLTPSLGAGYSHAPHYTDGKKGPGSYLTEEDMEEIIAYANLKGIGIVPCINAPGHMGAILKSVPQFTYKTTLPNDTTIPKDGLITAFGVEYKAGETISAGTEWPSRSALDLQNEKAYAFGQAMIKKYAEYFASKGIKYLNIGADEYAADLMTDDEAGTNNGMDLLYDAGGYDDFVRFVNDAAATIKNLGMTPRAYNDCIYYTGEDTYEDADGTIKTIWFDPDIEICYWAGGWSWGTFFRRADAKYLEGKGFKLINTNGDYYQTLGDRGQIGTETWKLPFTINGFHTFITDEQNNPTVVNIDNPAGAMFCLWCDDARDTEGGKNTGDANTVINSIRQVTIDFGKELLSQKPKKTETIELKVDQTLTKEYQGNPTEAYSSMDENIAVVDTNIKPATVNVGSKVTGTLKSGEYYLGNGNGYLVAKGIGSSELVSADKAIPWTITIESTGVASIRQGDYCLYSYWYDEIYGLQCVIDSKKTAFYPYQFGDGNKLFVEYEGETRYVYWSEEGKWFSATNSPDNYFYPYAVETVEPAETTITFTGKEAGTTYAYIGDVEYTIIVTSDEVVEPDPNPEDPVDPTPTPDPNPEPEDYTEIIVEVGQKHKIEIEGDFTTNIAQPDKPYIASVKGEANDVTTTYSVGAPVVTTPLKSGCYYLGNGNAYLKAEGYRKPQMVDSASAEPWNITIDSSGVATIEQNKLYLYSYIDEPTGYLQCVIDTISSAVYKYKFDEDNKLYVDYTAESREVYLFWDNQGWLSAIEEPSNYFQPYEAIENTTIHTTDITFEGKQVGDAFVTIGDVTYKIIVTRKKETITIPEGESVKWPVDEKIDTNTEVQPNDKTISTVDIEYSEYKEILSVGALVAPGSDDKFKDDLYYLKYENLYLIVDDGGNLKAVPEAEAVPWEIKLGVPVADKHVTGYNERTADLKQNNYFLSYEPGDGTYIITTSPSAPERSYHFDGVNDLFIVGSTELINNDKRQYLRWDENGVTAGDGYPGEEYSKPYYVESETTDGGTTITFHGWKVGQTKVTIGNVEYTINVVDNPNIENVTIHLTVNEVDDSRYIYKDISRVYRTEDLDIAGVTATLIYDDPTERIGDQVTDTMQDGKYYIGNGTEFLVVGDDGKPKMVTFETGIPIPWDVEITPSGVVLKQGEYYLTNSYDGMKQLESTTGSNPARYPYKFDVNNNNALYYNFNTKNDYYIPIGNYYIYWNDSGEKGYIGGDTDVSAINYLRPYAVKKIPNPKTNLAFYGYNVGETQVIIDGVKYTIIVTDKEQKTEEVTIPVGGTVTYKQALNQTTTTIPGNIYVDISPLYRRQDNFTWVSEPESGKKYYIMGIDQHYMFVNENGVLDTAEEPTTDQKWKIERNAKGDGYSFKYGDLYLVNNWNDGDMTLTLEETDTSYFPWQFNQNRGIYCTDKVNAYYLAHEPLSHDWILDSSTTRRIGLSEVDINEDVYATEIIFVGKEATPENNPVEVEIGDTKYIITVTESEAPEMEEVTIGYWITNNKCINTDGTAETNLLYGDHKYTLRYDDSRVFNVEGVKVETLVAQQAARVDHGSGAVQNEKLVFWRAIVHTEGYEQKLSLESKATSGTTFTYIRFYQGKWGVSNDKKVWRVLEDTDQLIAYYIQETPVTGEITTYAMDWGEMDALGKEGNGYNAYDEYAPYDYSYVLLDFAVKEGSTRTPDEFAVVETIGFHCDHADENVAKAVLKDEEGNWYRKLGAIQAKETGSYEVYMITLTPHSDTHTAQLTDPQNDPTVIENKEYTYDGTEKVVWVKNKEDLKGDFTKPEYQADGFHIGGEAYVPEIIIYERQAMLVTYYIQAKAGELEVYYHNVNGYSTDAYITAPSFYDYPIATLNETIKFPAGINKDNGTLDGAVVTNKAGNEITVSSDLTTLSRLDVAWRYADYEFVDFELSDDNKKLHLYYRFTTPSYVVDFGLPVNVNLDLQNVEKVEVYGPPAYGTATIENGILTYTPTEVIKNIDVVSIQITAKNVDGKTETTNKTYQFYPATTVYYEEGLMAIDGENWSKGNVDSSVERLDVQATEKLDDKKNVYGFDEYYSAEKTGPSNGTYLVSDNIGGYAGFTFTGTGVDIYANCAPESGAINVLVRRVSTNKIVKMLQINTKMEGKGSATQGQTGVTAYNIPVASIDFGNDHDTYSVEIRHIKTVENNQPIIHPVQLDGFRVYNTLPSSDVFKVDGEANPTFVEMRDMIFGGFGLDDIKAAIDKTESQYYTAEELASAMSQVLDLSKKPYGIVIDKNTGVPTQDIQDLLDNGPKNEVYLFSGQSLTFKPSAGNVQIGLKAINAKVTYQINDQEPVELTTSTDMFYELGAMDGNTTVIITNNSENGGILSITDLKWIPSAEAAAASEEAVMPITEENLVTTFKLMGFRSSTPDPEPEPEVTEKILYQTNANSTDVRLIAYLDDLTAYSKVSFELTIDGRTSKELVCTSAYSGLYANGELYTTEDIYGVDGYFVTYTINRYLEVYAGKEVTITVTYTTVTGETVTAERTVTIE